MFAISGVESSADAAISGVATCVRPALRIHRLGYRGLRRAGVHDLPRGLSGLWRDFRFDDRGGRLGARHSVCLGLLQHVEDVEGVAAERIGRGGADIDRRQVRLIDVRPGERRCLAAILAPAAPPSATPAAPEPGTGCLIRGAPAIVLTGGLRMLWHALDMHVCCQLVRLGGDDRRLRDGQRANDGGLLESSRAAFLGAPATTPATPATPALTLGLFRGGLAFLGAGIIGLDLFTGFLGFILVRLVIGEDDVFLLFRFSLGHRVHWRWQRVRRDRRRQVLQRLRAQPVDAELREIWASSPATITRIA